MRGTLLNLTLVRSATHSLAGNRSCSRWRALLVTGVAVAITASAFFVSDGLVAARPVQAFSRQSREAGADAFHAKGCEHCHGAGGTGTDRGPALAGIGKRWKKDRIELQIRNGGGGMPPFGDALQPDEVKDLVDYLSAMRKTPKKIPPPPAPKPSSPPSDDTGL